MLEQPTISTEDTIAVYYLQRTDDGNYAYYEPSNRTNKGRIMSKVLDEANENFWFYFAQGNEEGKYAIYSYATKLSATLSGTKIYANKETDTTVDYTIGLNEEGNGLVISAEAGDWWMNASKVAELSTKAKTSWKLIKKCEIVVEEGNGVDVVTSDFDVQVEGDVILASGLNDGTKVAVYDAAGRLIGAAVATNGTVAIDAKLAKGSTIIVKVGAAGVKYSLK